MPETSCLTPSATRPRAVGTPTEFVRIGSHVMVETGTGTLPSYAQTLPRTPESVRKARHLVRLALAAWGLDGLRDAVEVVVSELMTNAVLHARRGAVRVTVTRLGSERVHIAVVDLARKGPQPRPADADEESGRGLEIVEKLSGGNWGVDPLPWGKRVWAECALKDVPDE